MTVNGKENKGEDIKNPKLERKEQETANETAV